MPWHLSNSCVLLFWNYNKPKEDFQAPFLTCGLRAGHSGRQRFDRAKTRLEEVTAEIQEKQTASANMGTFLNAFEQMPDALAEFSLESWHSMVDFATVYSIDDIRFTFKNGQEIQT